MYSHEFKFDFNDVLMDRITGFQGTVVSKDTWITGCNRYGLAPKVNKDGEKKDMEWVDEIRLVKLPDEKEKVSFMSPMGGSHPSPKQYPDK